MGYKQGLSNIVECARLAARTEPGLLFVLVGDGSQRASLVNLSQRYGLRNIRFLPIQAAELFSSILSSADLLLVNQRATVTNMSLPGKLTSYFASARPIVAAVAAESETAAELSATGAGVLVPPDDPEALLETIRKLVLDAVHQEFLGAAGREYAETTLSAGPALAGLEALIATIAETHDQAIPRR
jgi:glycosyltransferase involved in cell wall biosynthesis